LVVAVVKGPIRSAQVVRATGLVIIAVAALFVAFVIQPHDMTYSSSTDQASAIDTLDRAREADASTVQQQTVAAIWTTNDYLGLISSQVDQLGTTLARNEPDSRPVLLLTLGVLAVCLIGMTAPAR
jgi:hypothetical protein